MRNIVAFCFVMAGLLAGYNSKAQSKYADSLKARLANTSNPADRFTIITKINEDAFNNAYSNLDSGLVMELYQIAQQLDSDSLLATSYNYLGTFFQNTNGDNVTALEYLFKAIPFAIKTNSKRRLSSVYVDIAWSYYQLQNYEEAIRYARLAGANLPDRSSNMYDFMVRQYQDYMAICFVALGQPDSALHYAQALNETNMRLKSLNYEAAAMHDFALVYELKGDKEMADFFYKKANRLADSMRWNTTALPIKIHFTNFLLTNDKIQEAKQNAQQVLLHGIQLNNDDLKQAGAGFLRRVYDTLRNTDSAYYYARVESVILDSIYSQNNTDKLQALAFKEQLRIIDENDKLAAAKEERRENIQYALLAFGIVSLLIIFLLLSRSIITNTKVIEILGVIALLIVFEFINLLLHPFLGKITHHNPVFMLLGMVAIAALIVPMHHRLEKWATNKLVEKNKAIRLANAKKTIEKLGK